MPGPNDLPHNSPYLDETEHATIDHTGIPGVGGGGGINSHIQIGLLPAGGQNLTANTAYIWSYDTTVFGGNIYITRGTDLTFSSGQPTRIIVATAGVYDILANATLTKGSLDALVTVEMRVNGAVQAKDTFYPAYVPSFNAQPGSFITIPYTQNGRAFVANDYIEFAIMQSLNTDDNTKLSYAVVSVTRRV